MRVPQPGLAALTFFHALHRVTREFFGRVVPQVPKLKSVLSTMQIYIYIYFCALHKRNIVIYALNILLFF